MHEAIEWLIFSNCLGDLACKSQVLGYNIENEMAVWSYVPLATKENWPTKEVNCLESF